MLKRTITYKTVDGADVTDDFYFNLSISEIAEMEFAPTEGQSVSDKIEEIIKSENTGEIFLMFKSIIEKAVGTRSEDGKRFIKDQNAIDAFFQSDAYTVLFLEWITDPSKASDFISGLMPANLLEVAEKVSKIAAETGVAVQDVKLPEIKGDEPTWITEGRIPTEAEFAAATPEQKQEAFRRKTS